MVVVAAVAIGLGVRANLARWRQLARRYEITAARLDRVAELFRASGAKSHEQWVADCRAVDEVNRKGGGEHGIPLRYGPEPAFARRLAEYNDLLAKKCHRAATQPWWPVEPDSQPPKP
jgi:hypothetical protein